MKAKNILLVATVCCSLPDISISQNIAINTSGSGAAATNMFEVTQTSSAANMVAIYAIHSGATAGTGYGLYASKTGAATTNVAGYFSATGGTNNYAGIFDQGLVGIGTTTPLYPLHIFNSQNAGTYSVIENSNAGALALASYVARTNAGNFAIQLGSSAFGGWAEIGTTANGSFFYDVINTPGDHIWRTTTSYTERMRITNAGNVGIGNPAPAARLDVVYPGTTNTYASKILHSGNASNPGTGLAVSNGYPASSASGSYEIFGTWGNSFASNYLSVRDNGNVGIGTTTPGSPLEIASGATQLANALSVLPSTHATSRRASMKLDDWVIVQDINANGVKDFELWQGSAASCRFYISTAGNVAIGHFAPVGKLDIRSGPGGLGTTLYSCRDFTGEGNTNAAFIGGIDFAKTNTGIYVLQKDNLGFATSTTYLLNVVENGNSKMLVTGAGNVGIGTTAPAAKLHVSAGDASMALFGPTTTWNSYLSVGAGASQVAAGHAQAISTNGNLHLDAGTGQYIYIGYFTASNTFINPNGGNVGIGTAGPVTKLDVEGLHAGAAQGTGGWSDGASQAAIPAASDGASRYYDWPSGWGGGVSTYDICGGSAWMNGYGTRSDRRFKKEIQSLSQKNNDLLNKFMQLRAVSYFINPEALKVDDPDRKRFGFIANEVEDIFPDLVINAGQPQAVARGLEYDGFIPILVNIAQEQQTIIEQMKNDKAIAEARIDKLEKIVAQLIQSGK